MLDTTDDGYDNVSNPFYQNWDILPGQPHTLNEFWVAWENRGYEKHWSVQAIYGNGIDYDNPPTINPLPNLSVFKNTQLNQAIDLWAYGYDAESQSWQLYYWISNTPNTNCGVTITADNRYISVVPTWNWTGQCTVTVQAGDGIINNNPGATFSVTVIVEPAVRIFLPLIMK